MGATNQHFGYEQTNNKDSDVCIVAFPCVSILLDRQSIPLWRQVRATLIRSPLYWSPLYFFPSYPLELFGSHADWGCPWSAASKSNCKKPGPGAPGSCHSLCHLWFFEFCGNGINYRNGSNIFLKWATSQQNTFSKYSLGIPEWQWSFSEDVWRLFPQLAPAHHLGVIENGVPTNPSRGSSSLPSTVAIWRYLGIRYTHVYSIFGKSMSVIHGLKSRWKSISSKP